MASIRDAVNPPKDRILSAHEAMEMLHIKDKRTLKKILDTGIPYQHVGNNYFVSELNLLKWVQKGG